MKFNIKDIFNAHILIVDDRASNVMLLEQLLREAGYINISSTMNPLEVCSLHTHFNFDLIMLDLQMPEMDGFQVMENLKTCACDDYLPVIVLTAQPAHKLRALQAGAKDFISKPFDLLEVKTRIYNMLEVRLLYKKLNSYNQILEATVLERTAELRESEARFRSLTELASDWYWEQDENEKITRISGPALEMMGMQAGPMINNALSMPNIQLAQMSWNQEEHKWLQETIAARRPFLDFSFSRINHDGLLRHFRVSGEPMFDQACRFIGYRGIGVECKAFTMET